MMNMQEKFDQIFDRIVDIFKGGLKALYPSMKDFYVEISGFKPPNSVDVTVGWSEKEAARVPKEMCTAYSLVMKYPDVLSITRDEFSDKDEPQSAYIDYCKPNNEPGYYNCRIFVTYHHDPI